MMVTIDPRKFTRLCYEYTNSNKWRITSPLMYFSNHNLTVVVPTGFVTDLDSIPRIPIIYAALKGRAVKSAIIHDYLYREQRGKRFADALFLQAMKDEGIAAGWRYAIYWGVCLGGSMIRYKANI
jgi:hypothetical protein